MNNSEWSFKELEQTRVTEHAYRRMVGRCIPPRAVAQVLRYGREAYTRGAFVHVIGRREVAWFSRFGIDLTAYQGIHVVCSHDGAVMTVYRNRRLKGLRRHKTRLRAV
jgi:hypothetical protein